MIYVWAVNQDERSKRVLPANEVQSNDQGGLDAFVPWVLSTSIPSGEPIGGEESQVYRRFYHFFAPGELRELTCEAAQSLGMLVGPSSIHDATMGVEIVKDGYEKSNWFIELKRWSKTQD